MANENLDPRELKEIAQANREFNDIVKESINYLKTVAKSYDTIIAKIDSMNKGVINTKKIQSELEKTTAKAKIAEDKYTEAVNKASVSQKSRANLYTTSLKAIEEQTKKLQRVTSIGNVVQIQQEQAILNAMDAQLDSVKASLQSQDLELIALGESSRLAKKLEEEVKGRLSYEKSIEKTIGRTGQFIGFMNKKFGIFKDTYSKIVEEAREDNTQTLTKIKLLGITAAILGGIYKLTGKIGGKLLDGLKSLTPEGGGSISKLTSGVSDMIKKIPLIGPALGGVLDIFSSILDIVVGIDSVIVKAGRNLGLNTAEATKLYRRYADISIKNGDIFLTSRKFLESQVELGHALEVNNELSTEALATNIKLKDIAGLEADIRTSIAENAIVSGKTSESLVKSVFAQVVGLKNATGISLNYQKVLGEANKLGGYLGLAFAKYPEKITKALVTTKALGTSLKEMDSIADSFLDFESSISKEFEAQLLTGKDINLQEARRAFLNNDLATAAMEINKQVGSSTEYLKMNRISAESFAQSLGMSRDQLGDMLKKQELLSKLGAKDTDNARTQLKIGLERYKTQSALSAAVGEEAYQNLINASTQEKIASFVDKIKNTLVDFIERSGIIDKIQKFVNYLMEPGNLNKILKSIQGFIADAVEFIGKVGYYIVNALDYVAFGQIPNDFIEKIKSGSENISAQIRSIGVEPSTVGRAVISNQVGPSAAYAPAMAGGTGYAQPNITLYANQPVVVDGQYMTQPVLKKVQFSHTDNTSGQYAKGINTSVSGQTQ